MAGAEWPALPFSADSRAAFEALGSVEVATVVHVLNGARRAERVLDEVATGLAAQAAGRRSAVLVADAGSQDATPDVVQAWSRTPGVAPFRLGLRAAGRAPRGRVVDGLLRAAHALGAEACLLVDGALAGLAPEWSARLLGAVLEGQAEFVSPAYSRGVAEGTLTTNVLAPLTRALYGQRIQQLAGGCAAFGRHILDRWLRRAPLALGWSAKGIEIGLVTEALASGARVVEVHLGRKPVHPRAPHPDLATTLVHTVGPVFALMEHHREAWLDVPGSAPIPMLGEPPAPLGGGEAPAIDRMIRAFRLGLKDLLPVWEQIMPELTLGRLYPLGLLSAEEFRLGPDLWARVVSDFGVAYHERRLPADHLLRALTPLYLGRVAAFLAEARARPAREIPDLLEAIGRAFEAEKDGLVARWR
jgi:hypothetical protein